MKKAFYICLILVSFLTIFTCGCTTQSPNPTSTAPTLAEPQRETSSNVQSTQDYSRFMEYKIKADFDKIHYYMPDYTCPGKATQYRITTTVINRGDISLEYRYHFMVVYRGYQGIFYEEYYADQLPPHQSKTYYPTFCAEEIPYFHDVYGMGADILDVRPVN